MLTQLSLANSALDKIGEKPITAITQVHPRAEAVARNYDIALREILREASWNFAKTRAVLTSPATPLFGWAFAYTLPANYIKLVKLNDATPSDVDPGELYEIENGQLLTDEDSARIEYVYIETNAGQTEQDAFAAKFDPLFADAFTTLLASKISPTLREDGPDFANTLVQRYRQIELPAARVPSANERRRARRNPAADSLFVAARRYSTNG